MKILCVSPGMFLLLDAEVVSEPVATVVGQDRFDAIVRDFGKEFVTNALYEGHVAEVEQLSKTMKRLR